MGASRLAVSLHVLPAVVAPQGDLWEEAYQVHLEEAMHRVAWVWAACSEVGR